VFPFCEKGTPGLPLPMSPLLKSESTRARECAKSQCTISPEKSSDLAAGSDAEPDFLTGTVLIAVALDEQDLRVDEDQEPTFLVFFEGFAGTSADPQPS